ncbi:hypothetical protein JKP88DRAFT_353594 [Tribonema minus]|uniref:Cns1/TTC4 wheel domain-containing protein n=1 Tax=Tribonema minus TaxID=303371 RepID=A0A835Z6T6_9STRA|nr:hypothetical protein JKP88DRAFT_353594 [Tribonema minus]
MSPTYRTVALALHWMEAQRRTVALRRGSASDTRDRSAQRDATSAPPGPPRLHRVRWRDAPRLRVSCATHGGAHTGTARESRKARTGVTMRGIGAPPHEGNERFKRTRLNKMYFKHAALFYTEAIKHAVMAEQTADMVRLRATVLANRAAANLGIKNYGRAAANLGIKSYGSVRRHCDESLRLQPGNSLRLKPGNVNVRRDCDESLRLQPGNVKCYFRKAKALEGLKQYDEAVDCCVEGLEIDPASKELTELRTRCAAEARDAAERAAAAAAAVRAACDAAARAFRAAAARGVALGPSAFDASHAHFGSDLAPTPDPDSDSSELLWPLLLLYPANGQSDVVRSVAERDTVGAHLAVVFPEGGPPPPWDAAAYEYRCSRLEAYARLGAARAFRDEADCADEVKASCGASLTSSAAAAALQRALSDALPPLLLLLPLPPPSPPPPLLLPPRVRALRGLDTPEAAEKARAEVKQRARSADFDPNKARWLHVHPKCTVSQLLTHPEHVAAGGMVTLHVYARGSEAHAQFLRYNAPRIRELEP